MIKLSLPDIDNEELKEIKDVLDSKWLTYGQKAKEFERKFSEFIGTKYAFAVNSGTAALQLAIQAQGLKGEIIMPSFTFTASANAVLNAGCVPVFCDIDYESCNLDPNKIKELITDKTAAILPVHFAGQSCMMEEICEIAEKYNLKVIEDSAEAIGAEYNGRKTGSFGTGCFSFYPSKNMTTGEGGMITTNNEELINNAKIIAFNGIDKNKRTKDWERIGALPGYNFNLSDILAAVGLAQLKKIGRMNESRRKIANYLNKNLDSEFLKVPFEYKGCKHVYQMYVIKVEGGKLDRDKFIKKMIEEGIEAYVHFPALHKMEYLGKYQTTDLTVTEKVSSSVVSLPMHPKLSKEELDRIIDKVNVAVGHARI
ncbi:DegT/DnrJ/EryC1/StrS family aminotransferase [Candidatus Woesearchaeota archaeon]|nr:DegT/DnrJ/EryC1/StrS family aminotransferase [Candidatus Woesearchaeota archaeon]